LGEMAQRSDPITKIASAANIIERRPKVSPSRP